VKLEEARRHFEQLCRGAGRTPDVDWETLVADLTAVGARLRPRIGDTAQALYREMAHGYSILFEGAQATLLDLDHGSYPFVTSSTGVAAGASIGLGIPPTRIDGALGIAKAYTTRVGEGPFPCELDDEIGRHLATVGREVGVNTGRPRRCGWFDSVLVRQTVKTSGITGIALTKLDVLDGLKEIKVCVGYELDGQKIDYLPASMNAQAAVKPIYESLEGWSETTAGARSWAELPAQAVKYVRYIEELIGAPVAMLSTSPERLDTILVQDPFQD